VLEPDPNSQGVQGGPMKIIDLNVHRLARQTEGLPLATAKPDYRKSICAEVVEIVDKSGKANGHPDEGTWATALQGATSEALWSWPRMNHPGMENSCSRNVSPASLMPNGPRNRQPRRMIRVPDDDHIPESNMNSSTPFNMVRHRARFRALWPLIPT
jgi:hypothetical protein